MSGFSRTRDYGADLTVKSASSAAAGMYNLSLGVNTAVTSLHATTTSASYTLVADTTPPTAPSRLKATANQKLKQIELSWNAATDNIGVVGYSVVRNGAAVGKANSTRWTDTSEPRSDIRLHGYRVRSGRESVGSQR